jgi:AraC family transcriptional regulator, transcriptional activator of pobA
MADTKRILGEFRKAISFYAKSQVVDLDAKFSEKFELHVLRLEEVFRVNKSIPPNRWSFHRIGIITEGTGFFQTGIYKFPARKNTLVVVPARLITSSRDWSDDVKGFLVLFNFPFLLRYSFSFKFLQNKKILDPYIKPYIYLNDEQGGNITSMFESMLKEQLEKNPYREELLSLKVIELIIECERLFEEMGNLSDSVATNNVVATFCQLLEQHFSEERSVSFYAEKMNVHPNYLNALVKKHTGETAKETINNRLLVEIKYLLHSTSLSMKEIAHRTGFKDPNYFTTFFRRMEKITPIAYRSSLL